MNKQEKLAPLIIVSDFQIVNINEDLITTLKKAERDIFVFILQSPLKSTANSFLPLPIIVKKLSFYKNGEYLRTIIPIKLTRDFDFLYSIITSLKSYGIKECDIVVDSKYSIGPVAYNEFNGFNISYKNIYFTEFENGIHIGSQDYYRQGIKDCVEARYPAVVPCVDIVIENEDGTRLLLAKKHEENIWRFVGGHIDVSDDSAESAVIRELVEETNGSLTLVEQNMHIPLQYLGSMKVNDWRYKLEPKDGIMTYVFLTNVLETGKEEGGDDIKEVKWFNIDEINKDILVGEHLKILELYKNKK